jgi:hypothetical protein
MRPTYSSALVSPPFQAVSLANPLARLVADSCSLDSGEPGNTARVYDRLVVTRPSDVWQRRVAEEAAELAEGSLSPDHVYASRLWPESLRVSTDAALAVFEQELHEFSSPSDPEILRAVQRLVVALKQDQRSACALRPDGLRDHRARGTVRVH